MKKGLDIKIKNTSDAETVIEGTLSWKEFLTYEKKAFDRLSKHLEIDGFRKGNVPEAVAKKHLGDELILADMAELAIQELYPSILEEHAVDAIGRPTLVITKLARENELCFTLTTATLPEIKLPDYKKIAKAIEKKDVPKVTEEEVNKVIEELRQLRAYGHVHDGDDHGHAHNEPLPEVNDDFAKSFGNFATVEELRVKIKENTAKEKERSEKDRRRIAIMDEIIAKTAFTVPSVIIESEQEKMLSQMELEIQRSGMKFDDYLSHVKKTKDDLKKEFAPEAERRAQFQMLINAIAKKEALTATDEEVEKEAEALTKMYPDADIVRAKAYADMVLTNEKVLSMLESQ